MSIASINYGSSLLGLSVQNLNNQLSNLSVQLSSGVKSTNYAGMGIDEGFAIAARSQLSNIAAFGSTMTNVNTIISAANTGLQSLSSISSQVQSNASSSPQNLTSTGQTIGQQNAQSELSAIVGILNTQVGNRYIYSGTAINTPALASANDILNGTTTQAGLKQVVSERLQADQGANGLGRLVITAPTPVGTGTMSQVAEDSATSPFGLKFASVTSSLTNAAVTGPSGSPAGVSVDFAGGNPNAGDTFGITFSLPDGTTESIQLTASSSTPLPTGSFAIGATPAATAANFNAALTSSISTLASTSLVAASAIAAGDNFFNTDGTAMGAAKNNQASPAVPITGADRAVGHLGLGLADLELRAGRHHHGRRHDAHLRRLGRDRQPAQRHGQRAGAAVEDRPDHGHVDAVDDPWRCHHAAHRRRLDALRDQLERNRLHGAWLHRHGERGPAAAAGVGLAFVVGNEPRQRLGQYSQMVHRQFRTRLGALDGDGARRFLANRAVRPAGQ